MVKQVMVMPHGGRISREAAVAVTAGDVMTLDANGKYADSAAEDAFWRVAVTNAAAGEQVAGAKEELMHVRVKGEAGTLAAPVAGALAVGDNLTVGPGYLRSSSDGVAVAILLEAVGSAEDGLFLVARL